MMYTCSLTGRQGAAITGGIGYFGQPFAGGPHSDQWVPFPEQRRDGIPNSAFRRRKVLSETP